MGKQRGGPAARSSSGGGPLPPRAGRGRPGSPLGPPGWPRRQTLRGALSLRPSRARNVEPGEGTCARGGVPRAAPEPSLRDQRSSCKSPVTRAPPRQGCTARSPGGAPPRGSRGQRAPRASAPPPAGAVAVAGGPRGPHGRRRVRAAALCSRARGGESPAPAVPRPGTHWGAAAAAERQAQLRSGRSLSPALSPSSPSSSSSARARAAAPPRPRPVPASSTRELSQRFAPRRRDWPAAGAASQWSRSEAASGPALGLPAEPAPPAADRVRAPGRRLRARGGAGRTARGAGARPRIRAGRSWRGAPALAGRRCPADPGGGGGGRTG